jgi:hypothetical protein
MIVAHSKPAAPGGGHDDALTLDDRRPLGALIGLADRDRDRFHGAEIIDAAHLVAAGEQAGEKHQHRAIVLLDILGAEHAGDAGHDDIVPWLVKKREHVSCDRRSSWESRHGSMCLHCASGD